MKLPSCPCRRTLLAKPYTGTRQNLLLLDNVSDPNEAIAKAARGETVVVRFDSSRDTLDQLLKKVRKAHKNNQGPFLAIGLVNEGPTAKAMTWNWATDSKVDLKNVFNAVTQLAPLMEALAAALSKTIKGTAHIDLLASGLFGTCKGLIPALEDMYFVDIRASEDSTGDADSEAGLDWTLESDGDYDAGPLYLDMQKHSRFAKLPAVFSKANPFAKKKEAPKQKPAAKGPAQVRRRGGAQAPGGSIVSLGRILTFDSHTSQEGRLSGAYNLASATKPIPGRKTSKISNI